MAAKGMALAEFLVKIGFNTAEINKQLNAIEDRLDAILKKRRTVTGKDIKDEKTLLDIKKKELGVATAEQRLAQQRARTMTAEMRARVSAARAAERTARAERRAGTGGMSITSQIAARQRMQRLGAKDAREQALQGPAHPGKAFLRQRMRAERAGLGQSATVRSTRSGGGIQDIAERKELLRLQAETMFRGGKINQGQLNTVNSRINSVIDVKSLGVARGHLAQAAREARRLRSELTLSNVASQRLASSTRQMLGNYVSVFAMAGGAAMVARSSMAVESARAQLFGANFGDQGKANADYDFFRQMSLQYGTGMAESIKSFSGFKYAGGDIMDTAQMRELFQSVTLAGVAGGATQADMDRTFYALKQMASKGKISSEELNLQLAEANPLAKLGVMKAFEEAYGRPASEMMDMMKNGEVLAKDVLPLVAKHLNEISAKGVAAGMKTATKQMDIMRATAVDLAATFGEAGGNEGLAEIFKGAITLMKALTTPVKLLGAAFRVTGTFISSTLEVILDVVEAIGPLKLAIIGIAVAMTTALPAIAKFASALMLAIRGPLLPLFLLIGSLEELFNLLETDPNKVKDTYLRNPSGTGLAEQNKFGNAVLAMRTYGFASEQHRAASWNAIKGGAEWVDRLLLSKDKADAIWGVGGTSSSGVAVNGPVYVYANDTEEFARQMRSLSVEGARGQ